MDDCGSPECHFLSGAQRTTRNVFGLLQLSWREELADTFVVVCRAEVINKKASRGRAGETSDGQAVRVPLLVAMRFPGLDYTRAF